MSSFVQITQVPDGEAPLEVREKWVGLVLPLVPSAANPRPARTFGVLSGPRHTWARVAAILLGRTTLHRGYVVDALRALEVLEQASPEAAAWWRENTPHMLIPGRRFLFAESCGQGVTSVPPVQMDRAPRPYDIVRVARLRDRRFASAQASHARTPEVGDTGTVLEVYEVPERAYEVECSNAVNGHTIWLEPMYAEELELVQVRPA